MGCHSLGNGEVQGYICLPNIYKYFFGTRNYTFEFHAWCGPIALTKKNFNQCRTFPRGFFKMLDEFLKLSPKEQIKYQVSG